MTSLSPFATHLKIATLNTIRRRPAAVLPSNSSTRMTHACEYHNMPFDYSNRSRFAAKALAYMGFGFSLPFIAVGWQWHKPGGYKNPSS
ncbi:hypothetical protein C8F04DRAFT_1086369 [Mycena alexandri]|uniref:Cytochrome c oxidase subunit 8, mitochondrial n=1 Tax=Mycena alexandri TaxID=1745969 RepID=A0AAD6X8Y8_9AGAR|nr:hypothetical protein C8F04DRAFT_1086369 [Mycena alexandri]